MVANLPFLENKKLYNLSRELGSAKITSCVAVDRGVACIIGDSQGFLSIFINEENATRDIRPSTRADNTSPTKASEQLADDISSKEEQNLTG